MFKHNLTKRARQHLWSPHVWILQYKCRTATHSFLKIAVAFVLGSFYLSYFVTPSCFLCTVFVSVLLLCLFGTNIHLQVRCICVVRRASVLSFTMVWTPDRCSVYGAVSVTTTEFVLTAVVQQQLLFNHTGVWKSDDSISKKQVRRTIYILYTFCNT